jgi:hemoglobin
MTPAAATPNAERAPSTAAAAPDRRSDLDRRDLDRRTEIHDMVIAFYREVAMDDLLGPIFDDVAEVDWAAHVPHLIDYWCRVLLREPGYTGAIVGAHRALAGLVTLRPEHFDRWFAVFTSVVDDGWQGPTADRAVAHASTMARSLARVVAGFDWQPAEPGCEPQTWRR